MNRICSVLVCGVMALGVVPRAGAQTVPTPDVTDMGLRDLLNVEVVSTASKFPQEVREAPASITIVTAEDIRRYGHRTLSDVLRSVRGLYTNYDRNYSYAGVRGFSRPGDYNTRVLLLVDGHRLNDPVYDMAPIGTDFPIDVSLIERVEIVRGPGSSLYGTNAFFAVINVITRTGALHKGARVDAYAGSLATRGGTVSFGRLFATDNELLLAGSLFRSAGADQLRFPEVEQAGRGNGVAIGLDHDESSSAFASFSAGRLSVRGAIANRAKQVPTGSFETVFGDDRLITTDLHGYVTVDYDGPVGGGWLATARLAYDYYGYEGLYPFDYGYEDPVLWIDRAESQTISSEVTLRRRIARMHLFTVGAEVRRHFRSEMTAEDDSGIVLDVRRPSTVVGVYVQDEMRLRPWLLVNAGVRVDRYETFGSHAAPRVGVVLLPRAQTAVKVLHGTAFRAPNPYEAAYFDAMRLGSFSLEPETVRSSEVIWEEYLSKRVRTTITAFGYHARQIIEQGTVVTANGADLYFRNVGTVKGAGVEAEIEAKLAGGVNGHFSQTYVRTHDDNGEAVWNSPRHLTKIGLQVPVSSLFVSVEGEYMGERLTIAGEPLQGSFVPNVTLTSPPGKKLDFTFGVYNVFNTSYSNPGGEEHVQRSIPQDGRTVLARVRVGF
jgi:outer membrane receptor for ferrienterochelin and colicins